MRLCALWAHSSAILARFQSHWRAGTVDEYTLACAFAPFGPITHVQVCASFLLLPLPPLLLLLLLPWAAAAVACMQGSRQAGHQLGSSCVSQLNTSPSASQPAPQPPPPYPRQVIKEKGSQLSRGYGFVSYAHPVYATVAMQHMNQQASLHLFTNVEYPWGCVVRPSRVRDGRRAAHEPAGGVAPATAVY